MNLLEWLISGTIPVPGGGELGAREVIGSPFGPAKGCGTPTPTNPQVETVAA